MLSYEWRELETLCERVADLRERYNRAVQSKHMGLVGALGEELEVVQRQRELVVQHISARLGSAAAGHPEDASPVAQARRQRLAGNNTSVEPAGKPEDAGTANSDEPGQF